MLSATPAEIVARVLNPFRIKDSWPRSMRATVVIGLNFDRIVRVHHVCGNGCAEPA